MGRAEILIESYIARLTGLVNSQILYEQQNYIQTPGYTCSSALGLGLPLRKNVSCASRAGCCWGWNRASKFQNELSTKLLVGISLNLQRTLQTRNCNVQYMNAVLC